MVVLITTADTVDDSDTLWSGAVLEDNLAFGRAGSTTESLEFEAGDDIIVALVAVLRDGSRVKGIKTGGYDYGTNFYLNYFILLLKINGIWFAEFLANPALASGKMDALFTVYYWNIGHCLWESNIDRRSCF
jgi:hypothetical protein